VRYPRATGLPHSRPGTHWEENSGDLRAKIEANTAGTRRLGALLARYRATTVRTTVDALIAYGD